MEREREVLMGEGHLGPNATAPMSERLPHYWNARVTVHYTSSSGWSDTGTISYMDDNWVELVKENGERLLIPVVAIRIIKMLDAAHNAAHNKDNDASILLRPAEGLPQNDQKVLPK